jgi:hypothetical protein
MPHTQLATRRACSLARRRRADESGAILVTAAILMIAVAAVGGLSLAGGSVYAVAQEGRRAADFSALAGAANLPTLNLGSRDNPLGVPEPSRTDTPLGTVDTTVVLPTLGDDFTLGVCAVAARQFGDGRAPMTDAYASAPTTCTPSVGFDDPWLQEVADCLAGSTNAADCAARLEQGLTDQLPPRLAGSKVVTALRDATTDAGLTGSVVTAELMTQVRSLNTTLGGRLTPLVDELDRAGGVHVDLSRLAPALLTPRVSVTITQQVAVPGAGLLQAGPVTLRHTATARRVIKNAVVVPAIGPIRPDGTFTIDLNPRVAAARDVTLTALDRVAEVVTPAADAAVRNVACPGSTDPCPAVTNTFGGLVADVRDATDPPNGPPPDAATLVRDAVAQREPIMVATTGYVVDPSQVLGSTVYSLPGVRQLLPGLLFIPALDIVPAVLSAGPLGEVVATPVATVAEAGRTRGLYRARLVD